jgi:hypothetical protein
LACATRSFKELYNNTPANACAQKPMPRRNDGQRTVNEHQTVMREEYAKTAARGMGLLQRFVSV